MGCRTSQPASDSRVHPRLICRGIRCPLVPFRAAGAQCKEHAFDRGASLDSLPHPGAGPARGIPHGAADAAGQDAGGSHRAADRRAADNRDPLQHDDASLGNRAYSGEGARRPESGSSTPSYSGPGTPPARMHSQPASSSTTKLHRSHSRDDPARKRPGGACIPPLFQTCGPAQHVRSARVSWKLDPLSRVPRARAARACVDEAGELSLRCDRDPYTIEGADCPGHLQRYGASTGEAEKHMTPSTTTHEAMNVAGLTVCARGTCPPGGYLPTSDARSSCSPG